jgi:hypothetical protein
MEKYITHEDQIQLAAHKMFPSTPLFFMNTPFFTQFHTFFNIYFKKVHWGFWIFNK